MFRRLCQPVIQRYNRLKELMIHKEFIFTDEELTDYQSFTFLSKSQIKRVYLLFCALDPDLSGNDKNPVLPHEKVMRMAELWLNPFRDRILKVFSNNPDAMYFEEFLEMMSVFSDKAPRKVKIEYAFRIYDFREDNMIGPEDLREMLKRLKGPNEFSNEEYDDIVGHIMADGDIDGDGFMIYQEFKHLLKKCPDFVHSFRIRI